MKYVIIGVPSYYGGNIRGSEEGPKYIRKYLIPLLIKKKIKFIDGGNVEIPKISHEAKGKRKLQDEIRIVTNNVSNKVFKFAKQGYFPIVLGGEHSIAFGVVHAMTRLKKLGIVYVDAHGDFNTPNTTPSGNIHGMVLNEINCAGLCDVMNNHKVLVKQYNTALIGTRDLDEEEEILIDKSEIYHRSMKEIKRMGLDKVLEDSKKIASFHTQGYHVSYDMDSIDPKFAPGVGVPVKGGFSNLEAKRIMRKLAEGNITSIDFCETNPPLDKNDKTSKLCAEMIMELVLALEKKS